MKIDAIRTALKHRHSGTVAAGLAAVAAQWYLYAAGYIPEPPMYVSVAVGCVVSALTAFLNEQISDDA